MTSSFCLFVDVSSKMDRSGANWLLLGPSPDSIRVCVPCDLLVGGSLNFNLGLQPPSQTSHALV